MADLSRSGARIDMDQPIRIGTRLQIAIRGQELRGHAKNSARKGDQYVLGVEFDDEFQGLIKAKK